MTRILADLPDEDIEALDRLSERSGRSRAAELREAVRLYLRRRADKDWIRVGKGFWKERDDVDDPAAFERDLRQDRRTL